MSQTSQCRAESADLQQKMSKNENNIQTHQDVDEECWDDAREDNQIDNDKALLTQTTETNHLNSSSSSSSIQQQQQQTSSPHLNSQSNSTDTSLHEAVFNNDAAKISFQLLRLRDKKVAKQYVNKKDKHGNTPLHLACMLGRSTDIVSSLLECDASVGIKNLNRWTPFHEACSYGNREIMTLLTRQLKDDVYDAINKNKLTEILEKTKDCRLVLKWEFQSWVPLLCRVLPSDVCVITKQSKFIRIDTSLLDYEMLSWKKSDKCLVYSDKFEKKWIIMDSITKKYQHFETQNLGLTKDVDDKVDEFMAADIIDFELKSNDMQLTRSTSGWIWKADKNEKVGKYNAAIYNLNNVFLVTRKRREHLSEEDLKRNKIAYKSVMNLLRFGSKSEELEEPDSNGSNSNGDQEEIDNLEVQHRESLPPPPTTNVTWDQYINSEAGKHPNLGREQKCKVVKTAFKADLAMSDEFPISKNEFLDLLSIVPLKMFKKLKEFIEMRLPDGFPVRLDVPVLPFLTARITFEDFAFIDGPVNESLFSIPHDYKENPDLVPLLSGKSANNYCNKSNCNSDNNK